MSRYYPTRVRASCVDCVRPVGMFAWLFIVRGYLTPSCASLSHIGTSVAVQLRFTQLRFVCFAVQLAGRLAELTLVPCAQNAGNKKPRHRWRGYVRMIINTGLFNPFILSGAQSCFWRQWQPACSRCIALWLCSADSMPCGMLQSTPAQTLRQHQPPFRHP